MGKAQFNIIMTALETRKNLCKTHLGEITTTNDISKITLAQAADLKNFCIAEETVMTNIVMVDLYHVIGMGNLTPIQMMKFTYSIKEYLEYRPTIKAIVKHLDSIFSLPKIPVKTQYKLQGLGGILLTEGDGPIEEDDPALTPGTDNKGLPFQLSGKTITVDITQLDYFITILTTITKGNLSCDNFKQKLSALKEYAGIKWIDVTASEAIGIFSSNDMYNRVVSYYNKQKMDC
jgi:hypothetical protein